MKYVTRVTRGDNIRREDDIRSLEMSIRTENCLFRANIHTVGAFLDFPEDKFPTIRGLGKRSLKEIMRTRSELNGHIGSNLLFVDKLTREDHIDVLGMSIRTNNCLIKAKINTVGAFLDFPKEQFLTIRNIGTLCFKEIMRTRAELNEHTGSSFQLVDKKDISAQEKQADNKERDDQVKYVTREDDIHILEMSIRTTNCLLRANIDTVGAFLDFPEDRFLTIRNIGALCFKEIVRTRAELNSHIGSGFQLVPQKDNSAQEKHVDDKEWVSSVSASLMLLYDLPISEMKLSVRTTNCLNRRGWTHASMLVGKSIEELLAVKNIGRKAAEEIITAVLKLSLSFSAQAKNKGAYGSNELVALEKKMASCWDDISRKQLLQLKQLRNNTSDNREALLERLCGENEIRNIQKKAICKYLETHDDQASTAEVINYMGKRYVGSTFTVALIDELLDEGKIDRDGSTVMRRYQSIIDYASNLKDDRQKEVLLARLNGKTLKEAASIYGVTRERARQIQEKTLNGRPRLREDKYVYIFSNYLFSLEDFCLAFGESNEVYHYLEITIGRKQKDMHPIENALSDEAIPISMRRQIEHAVYEQYVKVDGGRLLIHKRRPEIVKYVVSRYCREQTNYEDFISYYEIFLKDHDLGEKENLILGRRSYENHLSSCDYVLWSHGKRLRYYLIADQDYSDLIEIVTSKEYQNKELSTRLFFTNYPDLMQELDIRDEYELHNLLRKIFPKKDKRIHFGKNPTLTIGQNNRDEQVRDLLLQYAPISAVDLAAKMEELYGFDPATSIGSYFNNFRDYYHNGIFSINAKPLPSDRFSVLKTVFSEDYYSIEEIQKQYLHRFPAAEKTEINPYTLNTLGFHVYSGYVISRRFPSAKDYFKKLLTENDITNLYDLGQELRCIVYFSTTLQRLKHQRELIEFMPNQLVHIRRLEAGGVTKDSLENYCSSVLAWVGENTIFTVHSLRRSGFSHELDDLGFHDWFYSSLLCEDERFSSRRIAGVRILYSGQQAIKLENLLLNLLLDREKIEIYELMDLLEDEYGIVLEKDKLTWLIKESTLYYDSIMETVYLDYDTYFEEI